MLHKTTRTLIGFTMMSLLLIGCGVLSTPEEASAPIEAIPIATEAEVVEEDQIETTQDDSAEGEASEPVAVGGTVTLQIVQEDSEARFEIDEVLRGSPKHVVGTTDQVAGEILIDVENPSATQVGVIRVNARTLKTDSDFRDRAIANQILNTGTYEFITFTPTELVGFPESPVLGETIAFQIVGDLTIRDITQEVTFDVTATPISDTRLEGIATTLVLREDYGLTIPSVPQVADVSEEVLLTLDFVAVPVP